MKSDSVNKYMTLNVIAVDVSDTISRIAYLCLAHRVRRLPALENGRFVGIIARRDVLRALLGTPAEFACATV